MKTLERTRKLVWPRIERYLKDPSYPSFFAIPAKYKAYANKFWEINRVYPGRKGKYLRPTLVLLTGEAMGAKKSQAIKVATAMQLSEEWILIHDDIEDKSRQRRGKPTLHRIYGNELAINAGDSLHLIMWKIISDINSKDVSEEFYRMLIRTALGQGVEQIWTNSKKRQSLDDYFFVADSKSAYYSVAGPMRLGATTAGATKKQIDALTEFGLYLGRCFQLVDDILDLEQDKKDGKITIATSYGADYAKKLAIQSKTKADKIFEQKLGFLSKEPARGELKELVDFILGRKY